jgi:hypothetical protein
MILLVGAASVLLWSPGCPGSLRMETLPMHNG